jgi:hypothetical protein
MDQKSGSLGCRFFAFVSAGKQAAIQEFELATTCVTMSLL